MNVPKRIDTASIRQEVQRVRLREFASHHPTCSQYDHHIIRIGDWRFCLGCTSMYVFVVLSFVIDTFIVQLDAILPNNQRFLLGISFFIPALLQLLWKSRNGLVKFLLRGSLGISIWLFLSFTYYTNSTLQRTLGIIIFGSVVVIYSKFQTSKKLIECDSCDYNQQYYSCLIKYQNYLQIDNLSKLSNDDPFVRQIVDLRQRAEYDEAIILPTENIN